jgi:hypothetical protein
MRPITAWRISRKWGAVFRSIKDGLLQEVINVQTYTLVKLNSQVQYSSVGYYHKVYQQIAKQVVQEYHACTKYTSIVSLQFCYLFAKRKLEGCLQLECKLFDGTEKRQYHTALLGTFQMTHCIVA